MNSDLQKEAFRIEGLAGAKTLSGAVTIGGAKNAALPTLAALPLFKGSVSLSNIPHITDIRRMAALLRGIGVDLIQPEHGTYEAVVKKIGDPTFDEDLGKRMRASIILTGPVLARCGSVTFPHPGGCVIGERPIDLFLEGYRKMGATVERTGDVYTISAPNGTLQGAEIFFKVPSHTATETLMMAAVLAEGETVLKNCSMEPEITDLATFLVRCGAQIEGAGTPTMRITGGGLLQADEEHAVMPDRLEAGSFLVLGALCANDLTIQSCNPEHLEAVLYRLTEAGVPITVSESAIEITGNTASNDTFNAFDIKTHEYPGYPTDLQAPSTVFLTQCTGESVVFETIFEGRLHYTEDLVRMGADITMWDPHRVQIKGPTPLKGKELEGPDIRAGLAFIIAALVAEGESIITNINYIDRGYERIEKKLQSIGASVERVSK